MMRGSILSLLLSILTTQSMAADISLEQSDSVSTVKVVGEISRGDADNLGKALKEATTAAHSVVVSLDSPGGSLIEGLQMADLVHQYHVSTYVGSDAKCISACAIIFMGGAKRVGDETIPDRMLHPNGELGFHAPVLPKGMFDAGGNAPAPIAATLERQVLAAALQFAELTDRHGWQPSLVQAALDARADNQLVSVSTVGDAGRWFIRLDAEQELRLLGVSAAQYLCSNLHSWSSDGALEPIGTQYSSTTYRTFLSGEHLSPQSDTEKLDAWLTSNLSGDSSFAYTNDGGWRLGTEGMADSCVIDTDSDGNILDHRIYNDHMSSIIKKSEGEFNIYRPMIGGLFTWHLLPPFVELADIRRYDGDWSFINEKLYDHNGSKMLVTNIRNGDDSWITEIRYRKVKESLSEFIEDGRLLFAGHRDRTRIAGNARTFRKGCEPATYEVSGPWDPRHIELLGAAPIRAKGRCTVVGRDPKSSNARLIFSEFD